MTKSKDLQPRLLYPAKLSFRIEGEIKSFPDQKKTKTKNQKLRKQLKLEKNQRNGDHMEGYQWGGGRIREKGIGNMKNKW